MMDEDVSHAALQRTWHRWLATALIALGACGHIAAQGRPASAASNAGSPFPPQLWLRVPVNPTAFPASNSEHLLYEVYLTNLGDQVVEVRQVDVLDPAHPGAPALASFSGRRLNDIVQMPGAGMDMSDQAKPVRIGAGGTAVLFMEVALPLGMPANLIHRITLGDGRVQGVQIDTHHTRLHVLAPPVDGDRWLAADGPGNGRFNHHRRGIFVVDGAVRNSRRFAIDWKRVERESSHRGQGHHADDYYAYGAPVLSVADATVVEVRDGAPDNPPGHNENFHPAVPVTFANVGGNTIVLDLGDGQFAHYYHLKPGSVRVKAGDHVSVGQPIAKVGASGDAREPHLHFEVTTAVPLLAGEGIPYLIDRFTVTGGDGFAPGAHIRESPLDGMVIDFGHRMKSDGR